MRKGRIDQALGDLDLALAPDVVKNDGVASADASKGPPFFVHSDDGFKGLVLLAGAVRRANSRTEGESSGCHVIHVSTAPKK
jgi:hypothetical protein